MNENDQLPLAARFSAAFGSLPYIVVRKGLSSMARFGQKLAKILQAGDAIGMVGELGAGKSNLVRVMVDDMTKEYDCYVTSPTYTIANIYPTTPQIAHLDLYRLKTEDDFYCLGGEEYFDDGTITLVEWADLLPDVMPKNTLWMGFEKIADKDRRIIVAASYQELCTLQHKD